MKEIKPVDAVSFPPQRSRTPASDRLAGGPRRGRSQPRPRGRGRGSPRGRPRNMIDSHPRNGGCPFDVNGYCVMHPDVQMATKKRRGGWNIQLAQCPKCVNMGHYRKLSGETESMTSYEDSRADDNGHWQQSNQASGDRRAVRRKGSEGSSRSSGSPTNYPQSESRRRWRGDRNNQLRNSHRSHPGHHNRDRDHGHRAPNMSPRRGRRQQHGRNNNNNNDNDYPAVIRSHSRSSRPRSYNREQQPQFSDNRRIPARRTVCVNGRPFDKHGRCFAHPEVKLASKKMLGGWKIHMEYCPLCANPLPTDPNDNDRNHITVPCDYSVSGLSRLSDDSEIQTSCIDSSYRSRRSNRSLSRASTRSRRSDASLGSRSYQSGRSWSTNRSSKKRLKKKDDSFLPLDEDGYCLRHPDIQLAYMSKKGGLRILMDFCPACAEDSLVIGGSVSGGRVRRRESSSGISLNSSYQGSYRSSRSGKSDGSHSTYIESMPYIDGDGNTGHYTGHVDEIGQPTGRGKMKYMDGSKYDGIWHGGTKLHGKTSKGRMPKPNPEQSAWEAPPTPSQPPPPPPPLGPTKQLPGSIRSRSSKNIRHREYKGSGGSDGSDRRSRQDMPERRRCDESARSGGRSRRSLSRPRLRGDDPEDVSRDDDAPSVSRSRCNLSRLRRKCDEIESLLKGYSTSTNSSK